MSPTLQVLDELLEEELLLELELLDGLSVSSDLHATMATGPINTEAPAFNKKSFLFNVLSI